VRKENGEADVVFYPVLKKSSLEKYSEEQQKQLRSGKVILADTVTADGRKTKAFVQIDTETNQVMSVPTQVIARNLQVMAEELKLSNAEIKVMQQGEPLTFVMQDEPVTVRHQPPREGRHPLLPGRRQEMERADQKRMGQIHIRLLRLLDDGR
jgi:cobalamin biosynthesis Mg chelatase CobN